MPNVLYFCFYSDFTELNFESGQWDEDLFDDSDKDPDFNIESFEKERKDDLSEREEDVVSEVRKKSE